MPQLPSSIEAEQSLLGTLIVYPEKINTAYEENLQPEEFYKDAHRRIYRVLLSLSDKKIPIDIANVITALNDLQQLSVVGGAEYIAQLTDLAFSEQNAEFYIKTIQEKATLRRLIERCNEIIDSSYTTGGTDFTDLLADAENKIMDVTRSLKTSDFVSSKTAMDEVINRIKESETKKGMTGVPSGFYSLDSYTNGFQPGDLIILAARPSVGKTAFALNIALNSALRFKKSVAIFSLEMPVLQLGTRMLSNVAKVDNYKLRTGNGLENDDWGALQNGAEQMKKANIFMDDSPSIKVNEIFAKCRKLKADGTLDLIIIDYLQLIAPSTSRGADNRQQEVSDISRSLKALARELKVPVIALSQLSRLVEQRRGDNKPMLSDLRESGSIEQDADVVLFLYRPARVKSDDQEPQEEVPVNACFEENVIIGKHRNGQTGEITLMFQPNLNSFYDKEKDDD
ncbi:MAG: replicative DNA helicase [Erysipelotrichaceae bacterium]|nr:replicative DNA helicase [Erysipelotrichaceae bacterium]